jgi:hypothetical protein
MQQRAQCDRNATPTPGGGYTWWGEAGVMPNGGEGRGEGKGTYWMHFELGSRDYMKYMGRKHR